MTPLVTAHLCAAGGGLPPAQQQRGGPEAVGDGAGEDEAAAGQTAEANDGGLSVAAAGGEIPGESLSRLLGVGWDLSLGKTQGSGWQQGCDVRFAQFRAAFHPQ